LSQHEASSQSPIAPTLSASEAADVLRRGGLVAFPTETVYGLGADARNPDALARLYRVKGRPSDHPVILHVASVEALSEWARDIPEFAWRLARQFWPGPLTLILKRTGSVPDAVTGGQQTVGLRIPAHETAQELLRAFGSAIAAPSANKFGRLSPTSADHVRADLKAEIDAIVDGDACSIGIESTIVDCSGEAPVLLRPGRIGASEIEQATGFLLGGAGSSAERAPGMLRAHYAPRAKLRLLRRTEIIEAISSSRGKRLAALLLEVPVPRLATAQSRVVPAVAASYGRSLYANLRDLDATGADMILVEAPPDMPAWAGVNDRLRRAASA
jgi:L-threonylcarbamoyladenylate synthase